MVESLALFDFAICQFLDETDIDSKDRKETYKLTKKVRRLSDKLKQIDSSSKLEDFYKEFGDHLKPEKQPFRVSFLESYIDLQMS